jgi:hypothetical protein
MTSTPVPDEERPAFPEEDATVDDLDTIPLEADEADVIEQHQEVPDDEDLPPVIGE